MVWTILAFGSAFFTSGKEILSKKLLERQFTPWQIMFEESLVYALITLIGFYDLVFADSVPIGLLITKAAILFVVSKIYFSLLKEHDISKVSPIMNLSPLVLILLSYFILNEVITWINGAGILLVLGATLFLEIIIKHHDHPNPHAAHFSYFKHVDAHFVFNVVSLAVLLSFLAIIDRIILMQTSVFTNIFFTYGFVCFFSFIILVSKKQVIPTIRISIHSKAMLASNFFGVCSMYLVLFALSHPAALVSLVIPIRRTSTLMSSMVGGLLFHEDHLIKKMWSVMIMLIGIMLIVL